MFGFHFDSSVDTSVLCIFYTHTTLLDVSTPPPPPTNTINPLHDSTPDPRFGNFIPPFRFRSIYSAEKEKEKKTKDSKGNASPLLPADRKSRRNIRETDKRGKESRGDICLVPVDRGETPLLETGSTCVRSRLGQLFKN